MVRPDYAKTAKGYCKSCVRHLGGAAPKPTKVTGLTSQCKNCSKNFWQYKSLIGSHIFCTKTCADDFKRVYQKEDRTCEQCSATFIWNARPHSNSNGRFCSVNCKIIAQATGVTSIHKRTLEAARAEYAVRTAIKKGIIVRPNNCEQCGISGKRIEAAHHNYQEKLNVRWLCSACHRYWDSNVPKHGTTKINLRDTDAR
jgi:hypothetical protein